MPRGIVADPQAPGYVDTPGARRRWRKWYAIGLLAKVGISSGFIADAFETDGGTVRRLLRSETVKQMTFPMLG